MDIFNRSAIKQEAKDFIKQDKRWLYNFIAGIVPLLYFTIISTIRALNDDTLDNLSPSIFSVSSGPFLSFGIIGLLLLPIVVAYEGKYQLNCIRNNDFSIGFVYHNAFKNYLKYFITAFLKSFFIYLWSLLLFIPGIIKNYSYYFTFYIIGDNPDLDAYEAIKLSDRITKGHKFELFMLDLSFIFWSLSTVFILPVLFVVPYVYTTKAMYYENFKKFAIDNGIAAPEEFGMTYDYVENNSSNVEYQNNYEQQNVNINNEPQQPVDYVDNTPQTPIEGVNNNFQQPVDYNNSNDNKSQINNQDNQVNNNYIDKANENLNNIYNNQSQNKSDFDTNVFEEDKFKGFNNFKNKNKDNDDSNSDGFEV